MPQSVMTHQFSQVPNAEIPRSSFNRSHGLKTTFDAGYLVPIFVDEVLPGDTFNLKMTGFARLATPIHPIMDNMFMETFFFAVPNRLIWDNWEKFNGEERNPGDSTDFLVPTITTGGSGHALASVYDYMGVPTKIAQTVCNALHLRAYNLIWNEWFRDENLQTSAVNNTGDGPDGEGVYIMRRRGKRHDYFTSCLPWPQKGDEVSLPLGTLAPITGLGRITQDYIAVPAPTVYESDLGTKAYPFYQDADTLDFIHEGTAESGGFPAIFADLSQATASTINEIRQAFQIQRLQERDARGGTRYTEVIRSHFGVTSPDQRLQRPEFLGGGSSMVNIQPVAQTAETDATTPQGNLAAFGTVSLINHGFTRSFTEHCVIIGLVNVRADLTYQQGMNRMWSRQTRFDYYWPALSNIGEQVVEQGEIYYTGVIVDDEVAWGYQERYAEYRYKPSQVTGLFRSTAVASIDVWHLAEEFTSSPSLNDSFMQDNPPIDRVIAVPAEPHFLFDSYFSLQCARPMPLYGVPGMIDHF